MSSTNLPISDDEANALLPLTMTHTIRSTDGGSLTLHMQKIGVNAYTISRAEHTTAKPVLDISSLPLSFADVSLAYTILAFLTSHLEEARNDPSTLDAFASVIAAEEVSHAEWAAFIDFLISVGPNGESDDTTSHPNAR